MRDGKARDLKSTPRQRMPHRQLDTLRWRRARHAAVWHRAKRIEGAGIGNEWDAEVAGESPRATSVVGVFVRNQDRADILWPDMRLMQTALQVPQRETIIHQHGRRIVLHEDGIPIAATAKGDYPHDTPHFRQRGHRLNTV